MPFPRRSYTIATTYDAAKAAYDRAAERRDHRGLGEAARQLRIARTKVMKHQRRKKIGDFAPSKGV